KQRVLVDRQRLVKNVTFDRATILQLDADGTDGALDAAADGDVLCNNVTFDLCAFADQKIRGAQLAFDPAKHLRWTIALDFSDDRHAGADARVRPRFRRPLRLWRDLFNDRTFRLLDDVGSTCGHALVLLGCLALEAIQHVHLPQDRATRGRYPDHRAGFRIALRLPFRRAGR